MKIENMKIKMLDTTEVPGMPELLKGEEYGIDKKIGEVLIKRGLAREVKEEKPKSKSSEKREAIMKEAKSSEEESKK